MKILIETLQDETYDVWKNEIEINDKASLARSKADEFTAYFHGKGFTVRVTEINQKIYEKCISL